MQLHSLTTLSVCFLLAARYVKRWYSRKTQDVVYRPQLQCKTKHCYTDHVEK